MNTNVKKFNQLVARVFADLYKAFPVRSGLDAYDILDYEQRGYQEKGRWTETISDEDAEFFMHTLLWLIDSGYILGTVDGLHNSKLTLSLKGLELLKSIPDSVSNKESLGEQLVGAFQSGAKDSAASLVSSALSSSMSQLSNLFGG